MIFAFLLFAITCFSINSTPLVNIFYLKVVAGCRDGACAAGYRNSYGYNRNDYDGRYGNDYDHGSSSEEGHRLYKRQWVYFYVDSLVWVVWYWGWIWSRYYLLCY